MQLDSVQLRHGQVTATVCIYAAHVTRFAVRGKDVLFLSQRALFEPPKVKSSLPGHLGVSFALLQAIRGGVPIIFPQFSGRGKLPSHGFARNQYWRVVSKEGDRSVTLALEDTEETRRLYPPFRALYTVTLTDDASLELTFRVEAKERELSFTFALHSYFAIGKIEQTFVTGLKGVQYEDQLQGSRIETDQNERIAIDREVDRVYLGVPPQLSIVDGSNSRTIRLSTSDTLPDAVVWNPWEAKALKMAADFGPTEYHNMLCVEVAAVGAPVIVKPRESWVASHTISVADDGSRL